MKKIKKTFFIVIAFIFVFLIAMCFFTYKKTDKIKVKRNRIEAQKTTITYKNFKDLKSILGKEEYKFFKSESTKYLKENKIDTKEIIYNSDLKYQNKKYYFSFKIDSNKNIFCMFELSTKIYLFNESSFDELENISSEDITENKKFEEENKQSAEQFSEEEIEVNKDFDEQRGWTGGDGESVN